MVSRLQQSGTSFVHWLVALPVLLIFGVFAVDLNSLYGSKAELQAAADAAALAGANLLYIRDADDSQLDGCINDQDIGFGTAGGCASGGCFSQQSCYTRDGASVDTARWAAYRVASANKSRGKQVELDIADIQIGHWGFDPALDASTCNRDPPDNALCPFKPFVPGVAEIAKLTDQYDIDGDDWDREFLPLGQLDGLDGRTAYAASVPLMIDVNAVRVTVHSSAPSLFWGFLHRLGAEDATRNFDVSASATAYVGFAAEAIASAPLAICRQALEEPRPAGARRGFIGRGLQCGNNGFNGTDPSTPSDPSKWRVRWTDLRPWSAVGAGCVASRDEIGSLIAAMPPLSGGSSDSYIAHALKPGGFLATLDATALDSDPTDLSGLFVRFYQWWRSSPDIGEDTWPNKAIPLRAVVVDCSGSSACHEILGTIGLDLIWVVKGGQSIGDSTARIPSEMRSGDIDWSWIDTDEEIEARAACATYSDPDLGRECKHRWQWTSFLRAYGIRANCSPYNLDREPPPSCTTFEGLDPSGSSQPSEPRLIFARNCNLTSSIGNTGGINFGVRASRPVLVE